jgi:Cu-processing system permease protein
VTRWQVVIGKFLGHLVILAFATLVGFGAAGFALWLGGDSDPASWRAFAVLMVSSVALGGAFLAIGYVVSIAVRDRGTAGAIAIGVWLLFVLIYDMGLLGVLVADQGRMISARTLDILLLLNPADAYRLLNLTGTEGVSTFAGLAGLAGQTGLSLPSLVIALLAWIAVPLGGAVALFARRPV